MGAHARKAVMSNSQVKATAALANLHFMESGGRLTKEEKRASSQRLIASGAMYYKKSPAKKR